MNDAAATFLAELGESGRALVDAVLSPGFWEAFGAKGADLFSPLFDPLSDLGHWLGQNLPLPNDIIRAISSTLGTNPDPLVKATKYVPYVDPLILDLDGDGLEISPLANGVLFDTNGDGIKTGTAWAGADDGLLAWDRNGNGLIDSGRELFGDETLLANGDKAANGFAALAELDSNLDGKFDSLDNQFGNLRIWRDLNQDGVSQSNELTSLANSGVKNISLSYAAATTAYTDAQLVQDGSFTRTDGSDGEVGSFILAQNNFTTAFAPIAISTEAMALPDFKGSGWVRNLREAATLDPKLLALVNNIQGATSRADYKADVATLMRAWGNASDFNSAGKQALANGVGLILSNPRDSQERGWMDMAIKASESDRNAFRATLNDADLNKFDAMRERMVGDLENIYAYEAFTGHTFLDWSKIQEDAGPDPMFSGGSGTRWRAVTVSMPISQVIADNDIADPAGAGYYLITIPAPLEGMPHVETLWNRLVDDASDNLMPALRLSSYLGLIDIHFSNGGVSLDFSGMDAALATAETTNRHEGVALFLDLFRLKGNELRKLGWGGGEHLRGLMQQALSNANVASAFSETGYSLFAPAATTGTAGSDAFAGDAAINSFTGGAGHDLIDGQAGNDRLHGDAGNDVLYGGDGNDYLYGDDGNDFLDAGLGNDTVSGGRGSDIYFFGKGDGQDTLGSTADSASGKIDTLQFKAGVLPSEVAFSTSGTSLVIKLVGTTDQITVNYFLYQDNVLNSGNPLQQIKFADGTTWGLSDILNKLFAGTANAETIGGTLNADVITGQAGNDSISGAAGNDSLDGGAGTDTIHGDEGDDSIAGGTENDTLYGDAGNDRLEGGLGNDTVSGGLGSDTYLFGKGDGQDTLSATTDATAGKIDTLQFKAGVLPTDVSFSTSGTSLIIKLAGTSDQITVNSFLYQDNIYNTNNPLQQIKFADGTTRGLSDILNKLFAGTNSAETISGTLNADIISGQGGNDSISGAAGNDTLDGGAGADSIHGDEGDDLIRGGSDNDTLYGNAGNDTLNGGDGKDILTGGAGIDHFQLVSALGVGNIDTLADFVAGTDKIDLSKAIFSAFGGLADGSSLSNAEIGDHLLYSAGSGALSYDADGAAGSGAVIQIAIVGSSTHPASLSGLDFNIVA